MKPWSARQVAEAIGIVGVIGSLIFVGGELRQNAIATRAAVNTEVSVAMVELNLTLASSPDLPRHSRNTQMIRRQHLWKRRS